jgi:hypothetical protein
MTSEQAPRYPFRRRYDYDRRLLPNPHIASIESGGMETEGMTIGYPAWNLLYYTLYCSLPAELDDVVVLETGTNLGASTIVMAQALEDAGIDALVRTVDLNPEYISTARKNVADAGLSDRVEFHVEDSLAFLSRVLAEVEHVDFVFLDDLHKYEHLVQEIRMLHPKLVKRRGKIYFDNTTHPGVSSALRFIRRELGGNVVEFEACSWSPPGNAVWQPD